MSALIAAAIFGLALLLDLIDANVGDALTPTTLMFLGLLFVALHLAGIGSARTYSRGRR